MFGFHSSHSVTDSRMLEAEPDGGDEGSADGYVFRFEPYPEMSAPYLSEPPTRWRDEEPRWATDLLDDDTDESDPQPGRNDHDYRDHDGNY